MDSLTVEGRMFRIGSGNGDRKMSESGAHIVWDRERER